MLSEQDEKMLVHKLRGFDVNTLTELAGPSVVKIIRGIEPRGAEKKIAEVLVLRFDDQIFSKKEIRKGFIDLLSAEKIKQCASQLNLTNSGSAALALRKYFNNWTQKKSREFATIFNLSDDFLLKEDIKKLPFFEELTLQYNENLNSTGQLHPYQKSVKDQVNKQLFYKDDRQIIVQMPTGAGKTFTMLESIVDLLRTKPVDTFIFWIVNSTELARQSHEAFKKLWRQKGDQSIMTYRYYDAIAPKNLLSNAGIAFGSFSTVNALLAGTNEEAKEVLSQIASRTHTLVIDEAHSSPAETYNECISYFNSKNDINLVGLTATPGREDSDEVDQLIEIFQGNLIQILDENEKPISNVVSYLQDQGYLAKLNVELLETGVEVSGSNANRVCSDLAEIGVRNERILKKLQVYVDKNKSTLLFACSLDHVFALYVLCKSIKIECEFIVGETPVVKRDEILERFKRKEFLVLINFDILEAGIDVPTLDHVFITRPVGSSIAYSQIIGRALRGPKNGGRKENDITTLVDNLDSFGDEQVLFKTFWENWGI